MKFKVGDKVRVKTWDELIKEGHKPDSDGDLKVGADYFTQGMIPIGGKAYTVVDMVDMFDGTLYYLDDPDGTFRFSDGMLAPAHEEKPTDAAIEVQKQMREKYGQATERVESNAVEHPNHYTAGGIECIDAIRASLGLREFADYCKGNVLKYLWRYRLKNGVEDLRKAKVYLDWMIDAEEKSRGRDD